VMLTGTETFLSVPRSSSLGNDTHASSTPWDPSGCLPSPVVPRGAFKACSGVGSPGWASGLPHWASPVVLSQSFPRGTWREVRGDHRSQGTMALRALPYHEFPES
jgi:hypothetical protein